MTITFDEDETTDEAARIVETTEQVANILSQLAVEADSIESARVRRDNNDIIHDAYVDTSIILDILEEYERHGFERGDHNRSYSNTADDAKNHYRRILKNCVFEPFASHTYIDVAYLDEIMEMPTNNAASELVFFVRFYEYLRCASTVHSRGYVSTISLYTK